MVTKVQWKTAKTESNKIAILTDHWEIPNAPGLDVGWVQIAGTAPIFISDREIYKMNCVTPIDGNQKLIVHMTAGGARSIGTRVVCI